MFFVCSPLGAAARAHGRRATFFDASAPAPHRSIVCIVGIIGGLVAYYFVGGKDDVYAESREKHGGVEEIKFEESANPMADASWDEGDDDDLSVI